MVADVGAALADVAVAMHRAVEKIEDMKSRASAFERHHNAGTFDGSGQWSRSHITARTPAAH